MATVTRQAVEKKKKGRKEKKERRNRRRDNRQRVLSRTPGISYAEERTRILLFPPLGAGSIVEIKEWGGEDERMLRRV